VLSLSVLFQANYPVPQILYILAHMPDWFHGLCDSFRTYFARRFYASFTIRTVPEGILGRDYPRIL